MTLERTTMLETDLLTRRTPEAATHYNIKAHDVARFHVNRPVVIGRSGTGQTGTTLEYSPTGGRNWQIVSYHDSIVDALAAFSALGISKDRNPINYRILKEA